MAVVAFSFLVLVAAALFWLNKRGQINEQDLKLLSTVLGIVASIAAVVVFIVPGSQVETDIDSESLSSQKISYRHLTAFNEYPTLAISELNIPRPYLDSINISNNPIIYTSNPVFKAIETFKSETGSQEIFSRYPAEENLPIDFGTLNYGTNVDGVTETSNTVIDDGGRNFQQTREDFEVDTIQYKGKAQEFNYAPVYAPFKATLGNAPWTLIGELDGLDSNVRRDLSVPVGLIVQFPKFGDLDTDSLVSDRSYLYYNSDEWIRKVISQNSEIRGFLGFLYRYSPQYNGSFDDGSCFIDLIDISPASPYVRIFDIENITDVPITIESLSYTILDRHEHEITAFENRNDIFKELPIQDELINVIIPPRQHFLIPIEFGFESKAHGQELQNLRVISNPSLLAGSKIFLIQPENQAPDPNNPYRETPLIVDSVEIPSSFVSQLSSKDSLLDSIPNRFLMGSAIDIKALNIDATSIEIPSPQNEPLSYYTVSFGYGSCPYLLIYDSEKNYWVDLGNILSDRNEQVLQATETHDIDRRVSKIRLEEREEEVSYIDSISIVYLDSHGDEQEVFPSISNLAANDMKYLTLKKGESLEIDLQDMLPENSWAKKIRVNGYYQIIDSLEG